MIMHTSIFRFKSLSKFSLVVFISSLLAACGGGSGGSNSNETQTNPPVIPNPKPEPQPEPPTQIDYIQVKGELSSFGDVFSHTNVRIEAKCLNQTGFKQTVSTDIYGGWVGEIDERQLPCKIKAVTSDDVYYSYLTSVNQILKINPLSSYVIVQATKQLPEDWFASLDQLTLTQLNEANSMIRNELKLKEYEVDPDVNFLTSNYYDLLGDLRKSVNNSKAFDGHQGLVKLIQQGKVEEIPFAPEDYSKLNIDYSVCTGIEYQGNTKLLTHCKEGLLPDFSSKKLVQKNKSVCEISKQGEDLILKSDAKEYRVKINAQANDKITDGYPIMNTLLLAEGLHRVELIFQYDLLTMAGAYHLDVQGNMLDVVSCS